MTSLSLALLLLAQQFTQRGFIETGTRIYPQSNFADSGHVVSEVLFREEAFYKPQRSLELAGGIDLRTDTHHQVDRTFHFPSVNAQDRELQRPLFAVRRLSLAYHYGGIHLEAGKQFVRWGRTDILNPTDRFAPRDFLNVLEWEFLAIVAARATYERGANTIDAVWSPTFTPSRVPLAGQRWLNVPAGAIPPMPFPNGAQAGIRWNHLGRVEFAAAYYRGFNDVPALDRTYRKLQMAGGDVAVPLPWLTAKSEAAYFKFSRNGVIGTVDDYVQYVVQLERQTGEWFLVGGYAGEARTQRGTLPANFNLDRGLSRTIVGRAGYTIGPVRNLVLEGAVRQDGSGLWAKAEYSQAFGQHWRATGGLTFIHGEPADFLGQYQRNSNGSIAVKYSF